MKHLISIGTALALTLGLGAAGCSKTSSCEQLAKKLCEGKDDATCQKTKAWLDSELTGPNKEKLSSGEAEAGCKLVLDDSAALDAYKKQAELKAK